MKILNLTQHRVTTQQEQVGLFDYFNEKTKAAFFNDIETSGEEDLSDRCEFIIEAICSAISVDEVAFDAIMIDPELFFSSLLGSNLENEGWKVVYASPKSFNGIGTSANI